MATMIWTALTVVAMASMFVACVVVVVVGARLLEKVLGKRLQSPTT